jgi:carbamate kinase
LAQKINADLLIISTGVEQVAVNFKTPQQQNLAHMTLAEAKRYLAEGQFPEGSMKPKIQAVIHFLEMGGPQALITNPPNLSRAIRKETGTWISPL